MTAPATSERSTPAFLAVWVPSLIVIIATGACLFTISWWIGKAPGGGAELGLVIGFSSVISLLTVAAVSGLIDRADSRKTLVRLLLLMTVPVAGLIYVVRHEPAGLVVVLAAVCYVLISTGESLYLAATETVAVDLAPTSWPQTRTALLTQIHSQVERVVGPLLTGLLIAAGAVGVVPLTAVAVVVCMIGATLLARRHLDAVSSRRLGTMDAQEAKPASVLRGLVRDAKPAVHLVRQHRDLTFLVQLGVLANLIVFPFYAVLPAVLGEYTSDATDLAVWFGRAATAYGAGMLAGSLALTRLRRDFRGTAAMACASASLGLICLVLVGAAAGQAPVLVVAAMAANGALFSVLVAVGGAVWLHRTPAEVRVRVFALRRLTVYSSIPIGTMLMGFGGAAVGYRTFVQALAVVVLVLLIVAWVRFRASRPLNETEGS